MDTSSLIIGLVMTLVCALPLIYIARTQGKTKKKIKQILESFSQGKYNFKTKEVHFKKLYALDEHNKGFLFTDLDKENREVHFIDLTDFNTCRIQETTTGNHSAIILYFTGVKEKKEITLYDSIDTSAIAYWAQNEQIAKKWQSLIEKCF